MKLITSGGSMITSRKLKTNWGTGLFLLITHRGYRVPKLIEYFLVTCGTLALEGGPIQWVVTHRVHHAHTDRVGDPHTPRDGGWWAHIGWILRGTAQDHD